MSKRTPIPRIAALVLVLMLGSMPLAFPGAATTGCPPGVGQNPLQNHALEVGVPPEATTDGPAGDVLRSFGSILPGATEDNARAVAPPWFVKIARDPRTPYSDIKWRETVGRESTGGVIIRYDARDVESGALSLTQALGQPLLGSAWCGAEAVKFDIRTTAPIYVKAVIYTQDNPTDPYASDRNWTRVEPAACAAAPADVVVASPQWVTCDLPVTRMGVGPLGPGLLTRFEIVIWGDAQADNASIRLDNVGIIGSRLL